MSENLKIFLVSVTVTFLTALSVLFQLGAFTEIDNGRAAEVAEETVLGVPLKYELSCPERGEIRELFYDAVTLDGADVTKRAMVYVPYDYELSGADYNVLYFYHGNKDDETALFSHGEILSVIDNLIYYGDIEPLLIVTPTWNDKENTDTKREAKSAGVKALAATELRKYLIPAVEDAYRTKAENAGEAEAGKHRALAGLSYGAMMTLHAGILENYELFSSYGVISGAWCSPVSLSAAVAEGYEEGFSLDLLYAVNGSCDFTLTDHLAVMTALDALSPYVEKGENYRFLSVPKGSHDWELWELSIYDLLQALWKN